MDERATKVNVGNEGAVEKNKKMKRRREKKSYP